MSAKKWSMVDGQVDKIGKGFHFPNKIIHNQLLMVGLDGLVMYCNKLPKVITDG
jgi:hypothetical protein